MGGGEQAHACSGAQLESEEDGRPAAVLGSLASHCSEATPKVHQLIDPKYEGALPAPLSSQGRSHRGGQNDVS